jgi:O-antigen ligase
MYAGTSELFEFNKMIFIYIVTSLILAVWAMRMVKAGRLLFRRTPFDLFLGIFFLSQIASLLFSIDKHVSLFGYYGRFNGGVLSLIAYLALFYSLAEFLTYVEPIPFVRSILKISLISSLGVILWGLPGKAGHDLSCLVFSGKLDNTCWTAQFDPAARMFSTLGQPNWLGAYLGITFFITVFLFFTASHYWLAPAVMLNAAAIYFTNSRSSLLAVLGTALPLAFWILIHRKKLGAGLMKKAALVMFTFIALTLVFKTGVSQIDRYLTLSSYRPSTASPAPQPSVTPTATASAPLKITESIDIRKIVWQGAIDLGVQYPLFGTGVETFAYSYYFVRPVAHNLTSEWDYLYNKAHNEYLNYFATTGFFGAASYALFIGSVLVLGIYWSTLSRSARKEPELSLLQAGLLSSWIVILITNFVGFSTTMINLYFYSIPVLLYFIELCKDKQAKVLHESSKGESGIFGYLVVIVALLFFLQYFVTYWIADTKYALAENYAKANDYQSAVSLLSSSLALFPDHVYEDKLSYYMANLAFIAAYQKDNRLSNELMNSAESYNLKSISRSPENILYWKTRVKNQYLFYQITLNRKYIDNGLKALEKSRLLSPTDTKIPYFQATYYSLLWDETKDPQEKNELEEKSLAAIDASIVLKSDYFEGHYLKAQLLRKFGKVDESRKTYRYILDYISPGNAQVKEEMDKLR